MFRVIFLCLGSGLYKLGMASVSVAQNKPLTKSSSTFQSIDPPRTTRPDGSGRWEKTEWLLNTCPDI